MSDSGSIGVYLSTDAVAEHSAALSGDSQHQHLSLEDAEGSPSSAEPLEVDAPYPDTEGSYNHNHDGDPNVSDRGEWLYGNPRSQEDYYEGVEDDWFPRSVGRRRESSGHWSVETLLWDSDGQPINRNGELVRSLTSFERASAHFEARSWCYDSEGRLVEGGEELNDDENGQPSSSQRREARSWEEKLGEWLGERERERDADDEEEPLRRQPRPKPRPMGLFFDQDERRLLNTVRKPEKYGAKDGVAESLFNFPSDVAEPAESEPTRPIVPSSSEGDRESNLSTPADDEQTLNFPPQIDTDERMEWWEVKTRKYSSFRYQFMP